jgi:hypothetical protein
MENNVYTPQIYNFNNLYLKEIIISDLELATLVCYLFDFDNEPTLIQFYCEYNKLNELIVNEKLPEFVINDIIEFVSLEQSTEFGIIPIESVLGKLFLLENITIKAYLPHKQIGSIFLPAEHDAFIIDNIVINN